MAAADVFVEKAQSILTRRGNWLAFQGAAIALVAATMLVGAALYLAHFSDFERTFRIDLLVSAGHPNHVLALIIIRSLTISALFLGGVYFLVMIARALLHEAMVLFGRRHSLRFGRLYVYSRLGHIEFDDMHRAFGWSSQHTSAFADIRGERVTKTLIQNISDVAREVAKSTAAAVTETAKAKSGKLG